MSNRNRLMILLMLIVASLNGKAQDQKNSTGIKGGFAIPNLTAKGSGDNPLNSGYSSRLGPDAVIFWERKITNLFSIVPGFEYASEGGKRSGFQAFPFPTQYAGFFPAGQVPQYLYANFKNEVKLNYLMLNVMAKFNWRLRSNSPFFAYAEGGPFAGYLITAKDKTSGESIIYKDALKQQPLIVSPISFDYTMDIKDQAHKGNMGISGDVGLAYQFSGSRVFIEAGGNYGFLNIQKDPANGKNGIGAVVGRIGYAFSFGSGH